VSAEYQRFERRNDRLKANDQRMHERKRVLQLPPLSLIQIKEWIDGNPRGRSMQVVPVTQQALRRNWRIF